MNEEEKEKARDLLECWIKEAEKLKKYDNNSLKSTTLDNGNSGEYTKLTKKYQKLIEQRIGRKIWNK